VSRGADLLVAQGGIETRQLLIDRLLEGLEGQSPSDVPPIDEEGEVAVAPGRAASSVSRSMRRLISADSTSRASCATSSPSSVA
jgi:hypothetical protein